MKEVASNVQYVWAKFRGSRKTVPSYLGEIAGCTSIPTLIKRYRRHPTVACLVILHSLALVTIIPPVPPPIPAIATLPTLPTNSSYYGEDVSLDNSPQTIPVKLVRLDGSPALIGHYMVDMLPPDEDSETPKRFASSARKSTRYQDADNSNLVISWVPFLRTTTSSL